MRAVDGVDDLAAIDDLLRAKRLDDAELQILPTTRILDHAAAHLGVEDAVQFLRSARRKVHRRENLPVFDVQFGTAIEIPAAIARRAADSSAQRAEIVIRQGKFLAQDLTEHRAEVLRVIPADTPQSFVARMGRELMQDAIIGDPSAEKLGELEIERFNSAELILSHALRQFRVAGSHARPAHFGGPQGFHEVGEWTPRANGRELAGIADQHNALRTFDGIEQRGQLVFCEHRGLIHDYRLELGGSVSVGIDEVGAGGTVIAVQAEKKLRERLRWMPGLRLHPHTSFASGSQQEHAAILDVGCVQECPKDFRLSRASRANEH